ncbi:hypothetical protein FRC19_011778, partial [Serendipita sp. 401]
MEGSCVEMKMAPSSVLTTRLSLLPRLVSSFMVLHFTYMEKQVGVPPLWRLSTLKANLVIYSIHEDDGMNLTITFNYASTTAIPLTPSGGMLASIDDFTLLCSNSYSCYDRSIPSTYSTPAYAYNEFVITATQYRERASVRFSKGVYNYPTRRIGATTSLVQYSNTDPRISFTTGWTRNGTYTQAGVVSTQTFTMMFDGPAIWIWAFCGRRSGGYDSSSYGTLTLNGRSNYAYISSAEQYGSNNTPQDGKCLIWFKGNLNNTANTLTFDSERHNFMLHSIDVLNVQGGE